MMMNPHALPGNLFTRHPGLERTYGSAARATLFQFASRISTGKRPSRKSGLGFGIGPHHDSELQSLQS
jgi:hypothetical protein